MSPGVPQLLQWWQSPTWSMTVAKALVFFLLLVRVVAVFRYQHDIDESQNLHIVYGWIAGEFPYRDRFDNHAPLFAFWFAPLAWMVGENPDIVLFARLALLPIGFVALWLVFRIARLVAGSEIAWWTVAISLALADWSLKSVEFRPDVLWAMFWFLALFLLLSRLERLRLWDGALIGVVMGLALISSIKTTLLAPALALGCLLALLFSASLRERLPVWRALWFFIACGAGFIIPPVLGFGALIALGTEIEQIRYCLLEVNQSEISFVRPLAAFLLFGVSVIVARAIFRSNDPQSAATGILFATTAAYLLLLLAIAPELRKQTFLVAYPLVILLAFRLYSLAGFSIRFARPLAAIGCAAAIIHLAAESRLWNNGLADQRELLTEVLRLTDTGDYLIDGRGETVFADRPVYLAFVAVTVEGIESGHLDSPDTKKLQHHSTAVGIGNLGGFPEHYRGFLKKHYLLADNGLLRVAGVELKPSWHDGRWVEEVFVPLPGQYVVIKNGEVVDHLSVEKQGIQKFDFGTDRTHGFLIWKEAWNDGFRPASDG